MRDAILKLVSSEKFAFAAFPLVGYLLTQQYQEGFLSYFHVNADFAATDYKDVLAFTAAIFVIMPTANNALNPIYLAMVYGLKNRNRWGVLGFIVSFYIIYVQFISAYLVPRNLQGVTTRYVNLGCLILAIILLIPRPRREAPLASSDTPQPTSSRSKPREITFLGDYVHPKAESFASIAFLIVLLARLVGYASASKKVDFTVVERGDTRLVVLRHYGASAVVLELLSNPYRFNGKYWIVPLPNLADSPLFEEQLGPLEYNPIAIQTNEATTKP